MGVLQHAKVFGAYERRGTVRRGLAFGRRASKGSMACWAFGEGGARVRAAEDELLGLGVADDDCIIVTAAKCFVSIHFALCIVAFFFGNHWSSDCSGMACLTHSTISLLSREEYGTRDMVNFEPLNQDTMLTIHYPELGVDE